MAGLVFELPEDVLDELAERVAARVVARLERTQGGDRWLDSRQAADYLGVSLNALHKATAARTIPFEQDGPGAKLFFRRAELDAWRSGLSTRASASKSLPRAPIAANGGPPRA